MGENNTPLFTLSVEEFIQLNRRLIRQEISNSLEQNQQNKPVSATKSDFIFIDEVILLTGYKKASIYSKVSRFEIPVLSRHKPLTFSRKAIMEWLENGKPSAIDMEANKLLNRKP